MKKIISIFFILTFIFGCRFSNDKKEIVKDVKTIGVIQLMTNPGIDAIREGFLSEMKSLGYNDSINVKYLIENPEGDNSIASLAAKKLVRNKCDLIFAITTPTAQTCANEIKGTNIPLVFGAVTDPVQAGLVNSIDKPSGNITGTSDRWPIQKQFELLLSLVPSVKKVGVVYNPSESNSVATIEELITICNNLNLKLITKSVSNTSEVQTAAKALSRQIDAFYVSADNTVITAMASIVKVSEDNKIPLLPGVSSNVEQGGFGTIGPNYFDIGVESAKIADKILKGEKPYNIPVTTAKNFEYYFNLKSAQKTNIQIPDSLLKIATQIYR